MKCIDVEIDTTVAALFEFFLFLLRIYHNLFEISSHFLFN